MKKSTILLVAKALQDAGVRYLVVGGVAVNLHGHQRHTKDLDLVIGLEQENLLKGLRALEALGYRPRVPVKWEQFADPATREDWVTNRNMVVFQLWCDAHVETPIDIFVQEPFDFEEAWEEVDFKVIEDIRIPVLDLARLEWMKREAGRDHDLLDAAVLRDIMEEPT